MENSNSQMNINRRKIIFKIIRVIYSKMIKGDYHFPSVSEITAQDLHARMNSGQEPLIIDVRTPGEFNSGFGHIPNSKLMPLMELVPSMGDLNGFKEKVKNLETQLEEVIPFREKEVITICPGGGFSLVAAEILAEAGFKDVKSLSGGIDGWFKQGYPTTKS